MDGMLSQEEINALLGGMSSDTDASTNTSGESLNAEEKDAIGEISNICMGTAATTLYSLVNQKVTITSSDVTFSTTPSSSANINIPESFAALYSIPVAIIGASDVINGTA